MTGQAPAKKAKWYTHSFKEEWLNLHELRIWLKRDSNDPNSGYCKYCKVTLKHYNKQQ